MESATQTTPTSQYTYLPDGYNLHAKIFAVDGLHGAMEFTFRPMFRVDHIVYGNRKSRTADPLKQAQIEADEITSRIVDWNLASLKGEDLPIESSVFMRIPTALAEKIMLIIFQQMPADELVTVGEIEQADESGTAKN